MSSWKLLTKEELPKNPWATVAAIRSLEAVEPQAREEREGFMILCGIIGGIMLAFLFDLLLRVVIP